MSDHPFRAHDVADRDRKVRDSIRAKAGTRPAVDANGTRLDAPVFYEYTENGALIGPVGKDTLPATRPGVNRYDGHGKLVRPEHTDKAN